MTLSKDYKGPVSGGFTTGPDGESVYRSYTQEEDPVLTRDELSATRWFRDLPPNEQIREVRRLKWNLAEARKSADGYAGIVKGQDAEIDDLRRQLAERRPDGYELPRAAADLIDFATAHGWKIAKLWYLDEDGDGASVKIGVAHTNESGQFLFKLTWSCSPSGTARLGRYNLCRTPGLDWYQAPSLVKIKEMIKSEA